MPLAADPHRVVRLGEDPEADVAAEPLEAPISEVDERYSYYPICRDSIKSQKVLDLLNYDVNDTKIEVENEIETYLKLLRKTFRDKSFFMDYIDPHDIRVIIDVGCADGSFIEYLRKFYPNYTYVGIESKEKFRTICTEKNITVFESIEDYCEKCEIERSYVHMNFSSVIHEILTSCNMQTVMNMILTIAPRSYSIRDMYLNYRGPDFITDNSDQRKMLRMMTKSLVRDFNMEMIDRFLRKEVSRNQFLVYSSLYANHSINRLEYVYEFMMKYFYTSNLQKELEEQYFHPHIIQIEERLSRYYTTIARELYQMPWLTEKWIKDFDISFESISEIIRKVTTHLRLFCTRKFN